MHRTRCPSSPRPRPTGRAFTILEMVLAIALAAIVVTFAMGIFTTIDRAHSLQEQRMYRAQEIATLHRALTRTFSQLLMTDAALPPGDDLKKKIESDVEKALVPGAAFERDSDAATARLALQPASGAAWPETGSPIQTLEVTLRSPPVLGGLTDVAGSEDELAIGDQYASSDAARDRAARLTGSRSASSSRSGSRDSHTAPTSKFVNTLRKSDASNPVVDSLLASVDNRDSEEDTDLDQPRAPGLRGVFELRIESPASGNGAYDPTTAGDPPTYALWWRELPITETPAPSTTATASTNADRTRTLNNARAAEAEQLEGEARLSNTEGRQIKLLGGLTRASWKAFRFRSYVEKMTAKHDRELPAYFEFDFATVDGRAERWTFEVAWSSGPEPGSIVQATSDPLLGGAGVQTATTNPNNPADPNNPQNPTTPTTGGITADRLAQLRALGIPEATIQRMMNQAGGGGGGGGGGGTQPPK